MSWNNNDFGFVETPEQAEIRRQRERRRKYRNLGVPQKYLDSNIEGLKAVIESSKEGPLQELPANIEGQVVKSMGFRGRNFKNAWRTFRNNVTAERQRRREIEEAEELRRQEAIAVIEAERAAFRAELARQQAEDNARQAAINRQRQFNEELRRVQNELKPGYIRASKAINREEQRRKSRKARGKSPIYTSLFSNTKRKSINQNRKVSKSLKTKERNTRRKNRK